MTPSRRPIRRFWGLVWRYFDSPWGGWMPRKWAPWLFGKMLGSKGRRIDS